jgi:hypothetical protein
MVHLYHIGMKSSRVLYIQGARSGSLTDGGTIESWTSLSFLYLKKVFLLSRPLLKVGSSQECLLKNDSDKLGKKKALVS